VELTHETTAANDFRNGVTVVGIEAVPLLGKDNANSEINFKLHRGILIRAPGTTSESLAGVACNTHPIWIGKEGVTPENGMAIPPGNAIEIPIEDAKRLWIISTTINQRVAWMSL
jgi:hypothetical protein